MLSLCVVRIHACVSIYFFVLVLSLFIFYIPFLFIVTTIHSRIAHSFPLSITYYPFNPIPYLPVLFYAHCLRMVVLKGSPKFKFGSLKFWKFYKMPMRIRFFVVMLSLWLPPMVCRTVFFESIVQPTSTMFDLQYIKLQLGWYTIYSHRLLSKYDRKTRFV